ncbi:MAG TPA: hypothetical protein VGN42_18760 [Pirellulales bacterium]|jgi:hypothetical protein|nr:hypothetical protein [Pirellulales bacterium]
MTHRFPSFTIALLVLLTLGCQRAAPTQTARGASPADEQAQQVWRQVLAALDRHTSVRCKLYQEVRLYDQHLLGHGSYLQGPPGYHWSNFELAIKLDPHDTIVKQRCDGEYLWIFRSSDGLPRLGRVDVQRVLAAGRAGGPGRSAVPALGIGGLPKLFDAMNQAFRFTEVRRATLEKQPMYRLRGEWTPARLAHWLPEQKQAIEGGGGVDLTKLPPPIPDHVLIYVGADDFFPRRIEYRRTDYKAPAGDDAAQKLVLLSFSKVEFDEPVDRRSFIYEPGPLPVADETDLYIRNLGLTPVPEAATVPPGTSAAGSTR